MNIKTLKVFTLITIIAMIIVNLLSNIIPFGGVNTAQVSDTYKVFFVPAGYVFAIWGLIYIVLLVFSFAQFRTEGLRKIQFPIIISSIANCVWLLLWHNFQIGWSVIVMLILLGSLVYVYINLTKEKAILRIPFSIYLGWISVATIANISAFLYSINWDGFGLSGALWAAIMIIIAGILSLVAILNQKDYAYPLVIIWAITGILAKFPDQNEIKVSVMLVCILIVLVLSIEFFIKYLRKKVD